MGGQRHVLLLTGRPGVGKTTVIEKLAWLCSHRRLGGFYTTEIRQGGRRLGFRLLGFDGTESILAHVDFPKRLHVGRYGVDTLTLDRVAERMLAEDAEVFLVDEIGKMECLSQAFVDAMRALLAGDCPVIASVAMKGPGFVEEVKGRDDILLWQVTSANRDHLPEDIVQWLQTVLADQEREK